MPVSRGYGAELAVDERKGLWNCLGKCGEGGDAFSFVMKADGIGFAEAFELLSGISPQRRGDAAKDFRGQALRFSHGTLA